MDMPTKDLMLNITTIGGNNQERCASDASDTSSEYMESHLVPIGEGRRRNSLIDQFRDFLSRSVDFSFKIDDPFEKEMY